MRVLSINLQARGSTLKGSTQRKVLKSERTQKGKYTKGNVHRKMKVHQREIQNRLTNREVIEGRKKGKQKIDTDGEVKKGRVLKHTTALQHKREEYKQISIQ
jgi:hypothetical protein